MSSHDALYIARFQPKGRKPRFRKKTRRDNDEFSYIRKNIRALKALSKKAGVKWDLPY
jgi:hypothetical protein